jgi:hypothetical protein
MQSLSPSHIPTECERVMEVRCLCSFNQCSPSPLQPASNDVEGQPPQHTPVEVPPGASHHIPIPPVGADGKDKQGAYLSFLKRGLRVVLTGVPLPLLDVQVGQRGDPAFTMSW